MPRQKGPTLKPKPGLKPYPFTDGSVREGAASHVVRLVRPNCPVDGNPEIKQRDGTYTANPAYTGQENCELAYRINNTGVWDVAKCIELGHDPYFTKFRRQYVEEVVDDEGYVTESKTRWKTERRLNVVQVSDSIRQSSGQQIKLALARGCKFLEDFGIASPCEFRNCSRPQKVATRFGRFCSERHARLVAADAKHIVLNVPSDPLRKDHDIDQREEKLDSINIYG